MASVYRLRDVIKVRASPGAAFRLRVPRLDIAAGERIALVGESGCGKSTLLDLLVMVLQPTQARAFRFVPRPGKDCDIPGLWEARQRNRLSELRKRHIGYVMQTGGLLPFLSVRDNINLSRRLLSLPDDGTVGQLADALGISRHLDKLPALLSVGERQRVAIARALAHRPAIVVADEPTASVDPLTAQRIMVLFLRLAEELGTTVIVASHNLQLVESAGLRRIAQTFATSTGGDVTESIFSG